MDSGSLAGFPVVDVVATLYDGSYHEVDSSALAFQVSCPAGCPLKAALTHVCRVQIVTGTTCMCMCGSQSVNVVSVGALHVMQPVTAVADLSIP